MTATMTATRQRVGFRPDIEGLRAVAVLAVVLFHADIPGITGGYIGVDVFFVISGFLITGLLWREANTTGTIKLHNFYGARARRLLPASATVGIITMIASVLVLPPLQVPAVLQDGIASALYVGNVLFTVRNIDYFGDHLTVSPFQHYWSLGVEEQFYLVWAPLFLITAWLTRLIGRRKNANAAFSDETTGRRTQRQYLVILALIAAMSFALSLLGSYLVPAAAFFSLPTRAWQLALGGVLALTARHWSRLPRRAASMIGWLGLGMILLSCVWLTAGTVYPGFAALLPTIGAVLVVGAGCATPSQGGGRLLGWAPLQAIGRISYSWYLWHWPVLILAPALFGHALGLPARLAAAVLSAILAWLTMRYLEDPLRFAPKIRRSGWGSLGLGVLSTAIAVSVGLALTNAVPSSAGHGAPAKPLIVTAGSVEQTFAQVQAGIERSVDLEAVPANLDPPLALAGPDPSCILMDKDLQQPECASGDVKSTTTVALIGDSHAAMWDPGFQQIAGQRRWRLEMLAKEGCPLVDVPIAQHLGSIVERFRHCEQWRSQVLERMRSERPRLVIVSVSRAYNTASWQPGFTTYDSAWLGSLGHLVRQLRDTGAQVLVLGPIPNPRSVVPICLSAHLDDATACSPSREVAVNDAGIAAEAAATTAAGGEYADLTALFCTARRCPVIIGNTLVYFDSNHLAPQYSRVLAPVLVALANRALAHS